MNKFRNKKIFNKILIVLFIVMCLGFVCPNIVNASRWRTS